MRQIMASLSRGTRKPKAKEPEVYRGERPKLRGWLAQLIVYYRTVGWHTGHDEEKILYATSLLRDDAGTWITPYAEERITPTSDNWTGFKAGLQRQVGVSDAKGEARIRLKNMKQGKRSVTEYWNKFRLVASEAELDDSTGGELLLGGIIAESQNAWGASSEEYEGLKAVAQWAITMKRTWQRSDISKDRHQRKTPNGRPSHHKTQMGHTDPPITAIRTTATLWNWTRLEDDQDSTSQGKNSKEEYEDNYVSSLHNSDTLPGAAQKRMDLNHSTHNAGTGNPRRKPPLDKPDQRSAKSRSNRNPNSREMTTVPSKRWAEGPTRTKTHHHAELLRGTQLHTYSRKRQ